MRISIEVEISEKEKRVCEYAGLPSDIWCEALYELIGNIMEKYGDDYDAYIAEVESCVPELKEMGGSENVRRI